MVKKNYKKKILALFMAIAVSATSGVPVISGIRNVAAESVTAMRIYLEIPLLKRIRP